MPASSDMPASQPALPAVILPTFLGHKYTRVDTPEVYREHLHRNHEAVFVDNGHYHCQVNGLALDLPACSLLVLKPGDWHQDACEPPLRFFAVAFSLCHPAAPTEPLSLFAEGVTPSQQVLAMERETILPLIARMEEEWQVADAVSPMVQDALVREFFWRMVRAFPSDLIAPAFNRSSYEHSWYCRLRQYFRAHRDGAISPYEMAQDFRISERTLTNRCRQVFHDSPSRAFMHYKMEEAYLMLTQTAMTVKEVSHALGFTNPYHFSRAFKARYGLSPLRVRRPE